MKTFIINLFLLPALIAGLNLMPTGRVTAQTFTTLHSFTSSSDGEYPYAGLILSGNTLYGTADYGGSSGDGTVFAVNTDGTDFTNLHNFTALSNSTNSDGTHPQARLILSGNTLYGTAKIGGSSGNGTVFAVHTDGMGFTNLHNFTGGGDGARPYAGLILSGNTLYGTAFQGGSSGAGTVFAVQTNGTGFTTLHSFTGGGNGANPSAGLILSGNTLYGTAFEGGSSGNGTVFAVNTDGTGFTNLHNFTALSNSTNSDGTDPFAGLILSGNTLYGTAVGGGSLGYGTVFALNTNGTGFTNLHSFTGSGGGVHPEGGLILSGNTLYGTTELGGYNDNGTVFSLSLGLVSAPAPTLTIVPSGTNVVLTWPTNAAGFTLQSTTNLVSPVVWSTVSPGPIVVNGQNTVTNAVSGTQKFYRLSQ